MISSQITYILLWSCHSVILNFVRNYYVMLARIQVLLRIRVWCIYSSLCKCFINSYFFSFIKLFSRRFKRVEVLIKEIEYWPYDVAFLFCNNRSLMIHLHPCQNKNFLLSSVYLLMLASRKIQIQGQQLSRWATGKFWIRVLLNVKIRFELCVLKIEHWQVNNSYFPSIETRTKVCEDPSYEF